MSRPCYKLEWERYMALATYHWKLGHVHETIESYRKVITDF